MQDKLCKGLVDETCWQSQDFHISWTPDFWLLKGDGITLKYSAWAFTVRVEFATHLFETSQLHWLYTLPKKIRIMLQLLHKKVKDLEIEQYLSKSTTCTHENAHTTEKEIFPPNFF